MPLVVNDIAVNMYIEKIIVIQILQALLGLGIHISAKSLLPMLQLLCVL